MSISWMIGLRGWHQFTDRIGRLLVDSEQVHAGQGYCVGLALLSSPQAVDALVTYLDAWLPRLDCRYDQSWAMAALLEIDRQGGTDLASTYTDEGGSWDVWRRASTTEPTPLAPVGENLRLLTR